MTEKSPVVILGELVGALTQASGAAWQMVHLLPDPRFTMIRDVLDLMKEGCMTLAPQGLSMKPQESTKSIIV